MMGKTHLLFGGAGWLLVAPAVLAATGNDIGTAEIGTGAIVAAGAAMLPDLDHPQATVSRSLGPVSQGFAKYFAKAMGGHRNGSHSLLFVVVIGLVLQWALAGTDGPWVALAICFLASSLFFRVLTEAEGLVCAALSVVMAAALTAISPQMDWILWAVIAGVVLHDIGDMLTSEGIPPLYPAHKKRISLPLISRTGNGVEKGVAVICGLAACYLFVVTIYMPSYQQVAPEQAAAAKSRK